MTNEEFQVLVLQQLPSLNEGQKSLKEGQANMVARMDKLENGQDILATEILNLKSTTNAIDTKLSKLSTRIENEIEPKINALFEGHQQHSKQLTRIEEQVNKHEEYILRRIK